jgi:hypothetical protein
LFDPEQSQWDINKKETYQDMIDYIDRIGSKVRVLTFVYA